jgi:hypothetical protein
MIPIDDDTKKAWDNDTRDDQISLHEILCFWIARGFNDDPVWGRRNKDNDTMLIKVAANWHC